MHFVAARGSPKEIGEAQGESLRQPIRELLDRLFREVAVVQGVGPQQVLERLVAHVRIMEAELPHLAEEVHGVARGAGIGYMEAQLLNYQGEARLRRIDGCTSFAVASEDGGPIVIGQNVDMPPLFIGMNRVMHVTPSSGPAFAMWGFVGSVGQRGVNAVGMALMGNGLGGPAWRPGVSSIVSDRAALECSSIDDAVRRVRGLTRAKSTNMVFGDLGGVVRDIEFTPTEDRELAFGCAIGHANSYVHADFAPLFGDLEGLIDSPIRHKRVISLLGELQVGADLLQACKAILSDHEGYPRSICRHDEASNPAYVTTVSLIASLPDRTLLAADGPPCTFAYRSYPV